MPDNNWKMPDAAEYSNFQRHLIEHKGNRAQRQFLHNVLDTKQFLTQMDGLPKEGSRLYPMLNHKFTEKEFQNPPPSTEEKIYDHWAELSPFIASRPNFWAQATTDLVSTECIHSSFLAGDQRTTRMTGEQRVRNALSDKAEEGTKAVDDCVRSVLRRMSGVHMRGKRSIFANCILARAWWRERLVRRVIKETGIEKWRIREALKGSQHWEWFATAMVSRTPVFGNELVQNAVMISLKDVPSGSPHSLIQKVCQQTCIAGSSIELPVLKPDEIRLLVKEIVRKLLDKKESDVE